MLVRKFKSFNLILLITLILLSFTSICYAFPAFTPEEGIYVKELGSGDTVLSQNANNRFYPANTTKVMTAYVLVKNVKDLNQKVKVGEEVNDYGYSDSTAGLWLGEEMTYNDLLYALLLPSGNDAAGTIAVNVGRILLDNPNASKDEAQARFVQEMNTTAQNLGMANTHFVNPHGRHDPDHYTTPADMAIIAAKAFENSIIKKVAHTTSYTLINSSGQPYQINNTNLTLYGKGSAFGTDLITAAKTGTTDEAGRTFVYYSEQEGAKLVGVIFKTQETAIFSQSKAIVEELNQNYTLTKFSKSNGYINTFDIDNVHFRDGNTLSVTADKQISSYTTNNVADTLNSTIRWDNNYIQETDDGLELVKSLDSDQKVGAVLVSKGDEIIKTIPIYTTNAMNIKNFVDYIYDHQVLLFVVILGFVGIGYGVIFLSKKYFENRNDSSFMNLYKSKF